MTVPFQRTQIDGKGDSASKAGGLDCSKDKDVTRQEFAADADITNIMKKYGAQDAIARIPQWGGEIDYSIDLQTALASVNESKEAYERLHPAIREKFPTWQKLVNAMASGELKPELEKLGLDREVTDRIDNEAREARIAELRASGRFKTREQLEAEIKTLKAHHAEVHEGKQIRHAEPDKTPKDK